MPKSARTRTEPIPSPMPLRHVAPSRPVLVAPARSMPPLRDGPPGQKRACDAVARTLVVVPAVDESKEQVEIGRHRGRDRHRRVTKARQVCAITRGEQVNGEPGEAVADRTRQKTKAAARKS